MQDMCMLGGNMCTGVAMRVWCSQVFDLFSLLTFIRVQHRVVRWDSSVFAMRSLLCCVGWSIDCLCVYFCSMKAGGCMYRFGGMYILT